MTRWRLRLHHRIVIPFAVVALVATAATAVLALLVVSQTFTSRVQSQILNTSEVISRAGFALNPAILRSVKSITGADVITFEQGGGILATTIVPPHEHLIASVINPAAHQAATAADLSGVREMACDDAPCYVAYRPVAGRPGVLVAVVVETAEVSEVTRAVARTIVVAAVVGLIAMILVSQLVARRVTAPIDRLVGFTRDVTGDAGRRRAEEGQDEVGRLGQAFNEMLDRLDASQSALVRSEKLALAGLMAARVAHDIRNPLASIKIQAQLLQAQLRDDTEKRVMVDAVLQDVTHVESVIRDLIELARPGELSKRPADLNTVVRDTLSQLEARFSYRKITVDTALDARLAAVSIDVERLAQALLNVIINAVDAMPTGGRLSVSTEPAAGEAAVILDVCDDGIGIDPALLDRVFDPFVSSKPWGVGLGLVNAKAVVEHHGGRIELTRRQPRGTRARITLPV